MASQLDGHWYLRASDISDYEVTKKVIHIILFDILLALKTLNAAQKTCFMLIAGRQLLPSFIFIPLC